MEYPKEITEAISSNEAIIVYYYEKCESLTIHELHRMQDRLSTILYFISESESQLKRDYNIKSYDRTIMFSRRRKHYRNKNNNGGDSDNLATEDTEDIKREEIDLESTAYRLQNIVRRTDGIIKAINQRISTLKKEMESSNKQNS